MKKNSFTLSIALIYWLLAVGFAHGATFWASPGGTASACNSSASDPGGNYLSLINGITCVGSSDILMLKPGTYDSSWNDFGVGRVAPGKPGAYTTFRGSTGNRDDVILRFFTAGFVDWQHGAGDAVNPQDHEAGDCRGGAECRYIEWSHLTFDGSGRCSPSDCSNAGPMFKMTGGFNWYKHSSCFNDYNNDDCPGAGYIRFLNTKWNGGITPTNVTTIDTNSPQMGLLGGFRIEILNSEITGFVYGLYLSGEWNLVDNSYFHDNLAMGIQLYDNGGGGCTGGYPWADQNCNNDPGKQPHNSIVRNSRFSHNGVYSGSACYISPPQMVVAGPSIFVYNNVFDNAPVTPCNAFGVSGVHVFGWCLDCLIYNNSFDGGNFGIYVTTGETQIKNNIGRNFVGNGGSDGATPIQGGLVGVVPGYGTINAQNNVNGNPGWANPGGGNFQISGSGSIAYNAGINLSTGQGSGFLNISNNMPAFDANGVSRPQAGTWDLGACEWFSGAGLCPNLQGTIIPPVPSPVVTITGPTNADTWPISTATVTVTGTVTAGVGGGTVNSVSCTNSVGTCSITTGNASPFSTAVLTLQVGVNIITINASNTAGGSSSDTLTITYTPPFPGAALVGAWGFETGTGLVATDSSGVSPPNNGILVNGVAWTTNGRFGNGLSFDGTDDYVNVPDANSLDLNQSFTLSGWFQPSVASNAWRAGIIKNYVQYLYPITGGTGTCSAGGILAGFESGATSNLICQALAIPVGIWTHLAVTYSSSSSLLTLYRNGAQVAQVAATGLMVSSTGDLQIGRSQFPGEFWQGLIDEVRVYNYAIPLTAGSNTKPGDTCVFGNPLDITQQSIVRDMNCPVLQTIKPPDVLPIKIPAAASGLKLSGSVKFGSKAP
jgi:Concanavalin A-like lectin/glucanases superfamily